MIVALVIGELFGVAWPARRLLSTPPKEESGFVKRILRVLWALFAIVFSLSPARIPFLAWPGAATCFGQASGETSDELIQLVLDLLGESDQELRSLAYEQIRNEAPGIKATQRFAAQLNQLPAEGQVGLVRALADRGDRAARPAVLELLASKDASVREAAIRALGSLGEVADIERLVALLSSPSEGEVAAARRSLTRLSGDDAAQSIAQRMSQAAPALRVPLLEILAERRALDTVPRILDAAIDSHAEVRTAAMQAMGQIGSPDDLPGMVKGVLAASKGAERVAAEKAVMFVCERVQDPDQRAAPLMAAISKLPTPDRQLMLSTLGRVGGASALEPIEASIASTNQAEHAAGIAAIANWPHAAIAPEFIRLIKSERHANHRTSILRALLRVSVLPDDRADADRLALLKEAISMCERDADRLLGLQRAPAVRTVETLRFVLPYVDQPVYAEQASTAVVELAHHRALREAHKAEFHAALDKVLATSKNPTTIDRAQRYKNNQTWVRPK